MSDIIDLLILLVDGGVQNCSWKTLVSGKNIIKVRLYKKILPKFPGITKKTLDTLDDVIKPHQELQETRRAFQ